MSTLPHHKLSTKNLHSNQQKEEASPWTKAIYLFYLIHFDSCSGCLCGEPTLQYDLFQQKQHQQKHTVLLCICPCSFLRCTSGFLFWVASSVTKSPLQGTSFDAIPRQSHHWKGKSWTNGDDLISYRDPATLDGSHSTAPFPKKNRSTMWGPRKK